jgi:uncharacterized protein YbaR (Trm112 family)
VGQDAGKLALRCRGAASFWISPSAGDLTMSVPQDLLDILVCPKCKGDLEHRTEPQESLACPACRLVYAVEDDIPIMLIDEATPY